jgi:hypothetical protein
MTFELTATGCIALTTLRTKRESDSAEPTQETNARGVDGYPIFRTMGSNANLLPEPAERA